MQLSPAAFNAFLGNATAGAGIGQAFYWRRRYACPCITPSSGAARQDCPLCNGKGHQWAAEVIGAAGFVNTSEKKAFAMFGAWEPGDAMLTVGSDCPFYGAGQFDRFRAATSTSPFSYSKIHDGNDYLLGTIVSIARVFWLNDAGTADVEGGIPTVDQNGALTWTSGEPPAGRSYSITGVKYDEFFCWLDMPNDRNEHFGAALPKRMPIRKLDLLMR